MVDGLEFAIADNFDNKKMNIKSTFVGNTTQIGAINTTYAGMEVYPTESSNGWILDRADSRDAANTKWFKPQIRVGSVTTVGEVPVVEYALTGTSITSAGMYIGTFTLPTTEKFYKITSVSGYGGKAVGAPTIQSGIDIFDTTSKYSLNAAISPKQSSEGAVSFSFNYYHRMYIPGGSICAIWIAESGGVVWTLSNRTSGSNATSWSTYTGAPSTPYTSQASAITLVGTNSTTSIQVTYQGYY